MDCHFCQVPGFSPLAADKIMSAEFEWNLIVVLQRQGKDCISMKWAIDLSDESPAPRWAYHGAQSLWEPAKVKLRAKWLIIITQWLHNGLYASFCVTDKGLNWKTMPSYLTYAKTNIHLDLICCQNSPNEAENRDRKTVTTMLILQTGQVIRS